MHVVNLGLAAWVSGSVMKIFVARGMWLPLREAESQLGQAFLEFSTWAKTHRIPWRDCIIFEYTLRIS